MYRIAFVIEDVLGHITHGANLRSHVPEDPEVDPQWITLQYDVSGLGARLPVYRSNWTLRAGWMARRRLARLSRERRLDAAFFHTQVPATLSPGFIRRVPTVISVDATPRQYDELGSFYEHEVGPAALEGLKLRVARSRFRRARHVVAWSEWAKQGLVDQYGVPADKVSVISPGVNIDDWAAPARTHDPTRPLRLLFVGGDLERKGGLVLIEAFREIRDLSVELHIVTRDEVPDEPGIHAHHGLRPNSDELRQLYRDCDIFVLPTFGDCLAMVLSEAGAASLPTVSTRVTAIPEVVVDGVTGLLVPPGDVGALVTALRRLADDPDERQRMGRNAVAHIAQQHNATTNTRRLLQVLKQVADGHVVTGPSR